MAADLAAAYSRSVRAVPHCYPVSVDDFAAGVAKAEPNCDHDVPLHSLAAWAATEGGSILGFADVGVQPPEKPADAAQGILRFLWYTPGRRAAGEALLGQAEAHLRRQGVRQVEAFHQHYTYDFYYLESSYLSDRLGQVAALLHMAGYQRIGGEVFLDAPDFAVVEPPVAEVPAEITAHLRPSAGRRPAVSVAARLDGRRIGTCHCERIADYTADPAAREWLFTSWLGVEQPFQGKGLGRCLLARALAEMRGAGYRHAAISTAWDNARAFLFYSNFGYHVVDWTYGYGRALP
jgi:GNAT superfamily N-acetyltransferase